MILELLFIFNCLSFGLAHHAMLSNLLWVSVIIIVTTIIIIVTSVNSMLWSLLSSIPIIITVIIIATDILLSLHETNIVMPKLPLLSLLLLAKMCPQITQFNTYSSLEFPLFKLGFVLPKLCCKKLASKSSSDSLSCPLMLSNSTLSGVNPRLMAESATETCFVSLSIFTKQFYECI